MASRSTKTESKTPSEQSKRSRKVGLKDDPGVIMWEMTFSTGVGISDAIVLSSEFSCVSVDIPVCTATATEVKRFGSIGAISPISECLTTGLNTQKGAIWSQATCPVSLLSPVLDWMIQ